MSPSLKASMSLQVRSFSCVVEGTVVGRLELPGQPFALADFSKAVLQRTSRTTQSHVVGHSRQLSSHSRTEASWSQPALLGFLGGSHLLFSPAERG